jgi:hypothetical protein
MEHGLVIWIIIMYLSHAMFKNWANKPHRDWPNNLQSVHYLPFAPLSVSLLVCLEVGDGIVNGAFVLVIGVHPKDYDILFICVILCTMFTETSSFTTLDSWFLIKTLSDNLQNALDILFQVSKYNVLCYFNGGVAFFSNQCLVTTVEANNDEQNQTECVPKSNLI